MKPRSSASSVRQRLLIHARSQGEPFDFVLVRYGIERFLYRLGISGWADRFILKGSMLLHVWRHASYRPTRDVDLLDLAGEGMEQVEKAMRDILRWPVPDDGLVFDESSLRFEEIREAHRYHGIRVKLVALLERTRIPLQIDIGFGDVVTPGAETNSFPTILPTLPAPVLSTYPDVTVMAEKLEALVDLDSANSRMKDFYDLYILTLRPDLDLRQLRRAIHATFSRRGTALPAGTPAGLTGAFADDRQKMWQAFLNKNGLQHGAPSLREAIESINAHLPPDWNQAGCT
jgi:hypothetical protein